MGDWKKVKLQTHRQVSRRKKNNHKPNPLTYDSYGILHKMGNDVYCLQLPPNSSQIPSAIHKSKIKKFVKEGQATHKELPLLQTKKRLPRAIPDMVMSERGNPATIKVLVQRIRKKLGYYR